MNNCVSLKQLKLTNISVLFLYCSTCLWDNCFNNVVMLKSGGDKGNLAILSGPVSDPGFDIGGGGVDFVNEGDH